MGQALYRKYRSKSLAEIIGQEHITDTLGRALHSGRISHAYLFTGPKGVGKTSIARILAHEINGLPYDETQSHLDIIEIDAASNNGVEDVRDLREKVYVAPSQGKYKVYIIDEVHMLSKAAFNALLKTLEEPPAHVVFILATTEAHKLPATIVSRTQRFLFRPIEATKVREHLRTIADTEHITISDEALALIAAHGDGSFRDSIGLLDQASGLGTDIDLAAIQSLLGVPPTEAIELLANAILKQNFEVSTGLQQLQQLYDQGFQATAIAKALSAALRTAVIAGKLTNASAVMTLLQKLLEVPASHDPERFLEICLLEVANQSLQSTTTQLAVIDSQKPTTVAATDSSPTSTPKIKPEAAVPPKIEPKEKPEANEPTALTETPAESIKQSTDTASTFDAAGWNQVLGELKKQYNTLYSVARMAQPDFSEPGKLTLHCSFAFHQKRLHEAKNRQIISDLIEQVSGQAIEVQPMHNPDAKLASIPIATAESPPVPPAEQPHDDALSAVSNIFGGGELLQS